jgi:Glycosyltransferases, probably involved in cell wall biogenesis
VCDKVESVHGKREFGTKDEVIRKCFSSLCEAIRVYEKEKPGSVGLTVVRDNLRKETSDFLKEQLESRGIKFKTVDSIPGGNVGSFRTCFDIALKMDENQFVLFLEDDYLCHPEFISEILGFFRMFDRNHNSVFLNPTTDVGDPGVVEIKGRKYRRATVLPSKKGGLGIWWRQTWHSTSTFAAKVGSLLKHKKVFDEIFKQKELNQYKRNTIFSESPCF